MTAARFAASGVLSLSAALLLVASGRPAAGQPLSTVVPYYGAAYGPPGAWTVADVKRHLDLMEQIAANTAPRAAVKAPGPDLALAVRTHCAACHRPGSADAKGGGFVLLATDAADSPLRPLGTREKQRVKESVVSGDMPPNRKLTPEQRSAFE